MKIPPHAKKVFSGYVFDVYHWPQEMYDGTTATFEGLKRPDTTEIIAVQDGKIVIAEQEQPMKPRSYSLFGGRSELGEQPLEAAKRELLEESGLVSDDWELYKNYEYDGKIEWNNYLYIARNCRKVADQKLDAGERIDIVAIDFDEFITHALDRKFWVVDKFVVELFQIKDSGLLGEFKKKLGLEA